MYDTPRKPLITRLCSYFDHFCVITGLRLTLFPFKKLFCMVHPLKRMRGIKMSAEIYLIRHGETEWNKERRFQGNMDSPLTDLGRSQAASSARILARALKGKRSALTFQTSPLGRARKTATIIQEQCELCIPVIEQRLREKSMGSWDGLTHEEVKERWPEHQHNWKMREAPDGETYDLCCERISNWLDEQSGVVVAVSHGVTSRVLRGHYLGLPREDAMQLPVPHGVVWRFYRGNVDLLDC
jgi:probable phosphoglycerate mutase